MKNYLNIKNLISLYYVFFFSYVLYGILGWGSAAKTAIKPIQILPYKVLIIINNSTWKDHIVNNSLRYKCKILKISNIYKFEFSKFMYNYHQKALSEIFEAYFLPIAQAHNYNT